MENLNRKNDLVKNFNFEINCITNNIMRMYKLVEDGDIEAIRVYCELKKVHDILGQTADAIKKLVIEESERYSNKENIEFEGKLIKIQNRRSWSYNHIPAWKAQKEYIAELTEQPIKQLKKIEELAKTAYENGSSIAIEETGEIVEPAKCTYKDIIVIQETKNVSESN